MKTVQKERLIIVILTIIIAIMGVFGYKKIHTTNVQLINNQETIQNLKNEKDTLKVKINQAEQTKNLAIQNNTNPATQENKEMYQTINKVFDCFYNFTPDNYTSREDTIKNELSKEMREQLFPQNIKNYTGKLTSKLDDIGVYSNVYYTQTGEKTALVLINYSTKYKGSETYKRKAIWKVSYDVKKKMINKIEAISVEH